MCILVKTWVEGLRRMYIDLSIKISSSKREKRSITESEHN